MEEQAKRILVQRHGSALLCVAAELPLRVTGLALAAADGRAGHHLPGALGHPPVTPVTQVTVNDATVRRMGPLHCFINQIIKLT